MWAKNVVRLLAGRFGPHRTFASAPRLWILTYHRILPKTDDRFAREEPGMIVTPETFDQHLRELKKLFTVLPLAEWIARQKQGQSLPKRACAITFDDGWADNFEYALPLLIKHQLPATVFAVSHMIGTQLTFWPNRLARLLGLGTRNGRLKWLSAVSGYSDSGSLGREAIAMVINECKDFGDAELLERLDGAERELGIAAPTASSLMSWDQLRALQDSGLVEIGSHTCHHFRLTEALPVEIMAKEVTESRAFLERQLERPVRLFCYPNGDVSAQAARLVGETYLGAVTTKRGINKTSVDMHRMRRIGVHEDISGTPTLFQARLSGWV